MIRSSTRIKQSEKTGDWAVKEKTFSNTVSGFVKRAFDVVVASIGLILLAPVFLLIAILIKRDSPGPVFYWGPRIGRNGKVFQILKFRTMYETPKSYLGLPVTCMEDERITSLGKWLRDTKINELPQLWNVLIGEMSLVGPRPEDPDISKTWPHRVAFELLSVRPGLTSPASILYRDEESMLHAGEVMRKYLHELSPDKIRLDQLYVHYRSFWLDLDVILWTAFLLLPRIKTYSPPEQLLFVGPVTRLMQRYLGWFAWDFLTVLMSISIVSGVVRLFGPLNIGWLRALEMALGYTLICGIAGVLINTNLISWSKATSWESGSLTITWFAASALTLGLHYYYFGFTSLRAIGVILGASILSLFGFTFVRYRRRFVSGLLSRLRASRLDARLPRERVLIVGSGRTAEHIAWLMGHPTYSRKFHIVGFIDDDLLSQGMKIYGARVIGRVADVQRIARERHVDLIILADNQVTLRKYKEFRDMTIYNPARVVVAPDIFGSLSNLDGGSQANSAAGSLNDFQCQHCLARFGNHQSQTRSNPN
jgi:lipopolysaccharide/colanic/teichoic acid biosynthesis glycosyltransferase